MNNNKVVSKEPVFPTVKDLLPTDQWIRRVESPGYKKRTRNIIKIIKGLCPLESKLSQAKKNAVHFFLDIVSFDETNRMRSPAEKISDALKEKMPTDSLKY